MKHGISEGERVSLAGKPALVVARMPTIRMPMARITYILGKDLGEDPEAV